MLVVSSKTPSRQLQSLAEADSLIEYELANFSISSNQVNQVSIDIDSSFSRKIYKVDLPPGFSKTQLHAELNRTFHPLGISTPALVTFPDQKMQIHLRYEGTIVRTITLNTNQDLVYRRDHASIIVALNDFPDEELTTMLTSFGEPIPIVLSVEHPMQANELQKSLSGRYRRLLYWLQNEENEDLIRKHPSLALRRLKQFEDILPSAHLLLSNGSSSADSENIVSQTDLTYVDARDAFILHEELGKASFLSKLDKLKASPSYPLAIIMGNETTLRWLDEKLPELKKAGVELIPPPKITF
ncbi:hypothetical protein [Fodinibius sediminis]|nr:hypothetical protein [Fodinibius sediminis]